MVFYKNCFVVSQCFITIKDAFAIVSFEKFAFTFRLHNNLTMSPMISTEKDMMVKDIREGSVGWMLNALAAALNLTMKKQLESLDLTIHQFMILMVLLETDGISQAAIGKKVILPGYAITRNLDALEKQGLVKRQSDQSSRRSFSILLTQQGYTLAPSLFQIITEVNADLLSSLTPEEAGQFKLTLSQLVSEKVHDS